MAWIVENAAWLYVVLGLVPFAFGVRWYLGRRRQDSIAFVVSLVPIVVLWLLTLFVVTDRKRLEQTVDSMVEYYNNGKFGKLQELLADEVEIETPGPPEKMTRANVIATVKKMQARGIANHVTVMNREAEKVERPESVVWFLAQSQDSKENIRLRVKVTFRLVRDDLWQMKRIGFYNLVGDDKPIAIPLRGW